MIDMYCKKIMYNGKVLSGGAARNVRIMQAGGLENMISVATQQTALFMAQQFMGGKVNNSHHSSQ